VIRAQLPGSDFGDIALRFADSLLEPNDLSGRDNDPDFADAVRLLAVNQVSEPIECDEGYHVVQRIA
jgi:hypothetical protein